MNCKNCKKTIKDDSIFCEFCGAKIKSAKKIASDALATYGKSDKDLENFQSKPLFRLLKIIYVLGFCFSIFSAVAITYDGVKPSNEIFNNEKTLITCNNEAKFSPSDAGINLNDGTLFGTIGSILTGDVSGGRMVQGEKNSAIASISTACFNRGPSSDNNESGYNNIDFQFKTQWVKFITYLISSIILVVVVFEALKQLVYYIFLGRIYLPRWIIKCARSMWY